MQTISAIPIALWRLAKSTLKSALIGTAIPVVIYGALLTAIILLLSLAAGLPLELAAQRVLAGLQFPDLTLFSLPAAIPLTLAALAAVSHWLLAWHQLLSTPGGRDWLLPAQRRMALLCRLACRLLPAAAQLAAPRWAMPAAALSLNHPHRTAVCTAADLSGAAPQLN